MKLNTIKKPILLAALLTLSSAGTAFALSATVAVFHFANVEPEAFGWAIIEDPETIIGEGNHRNRVMTFDGYIDGKRTVQWTGEMQPVDLFDWVPHTTTVTFERDGLVTLFVEPEGFLTGDVVYTFERKSSWFWQGTKFIHDYGNLHSADGSMPDALVHSVHRAVVEPNTVALAAELALP